MVNMVAGEEGFDCFDGVLPGLGYLSLGFWSDDGLGDDEQQEEDRFSHIL
jgi:hypothetical protein